MFTPINEGKGPTVPASASRPVSAQTVPPAPLVLMAALAIPVVGSYVLEIVIRLHYIDRK